MGGKAVCSVGDPARVGHGEGTSLIPITAAPYLLLLNLATFHHALPSQAEQGHYLVGLEHGQLWRPWRAMVEQLGGEGGIGDLHTFLQGLQEGIAGAFQQRPHMESILQDQRGRSLLHFANQEKESSGRISLRNFNLNINLLP